VSERAAEDRRALGRRRPDRFAPHRADGENGSDAPAHPKISEKRDGARRETGGDLSRVRVSERAESSKEGSSGRRRERPKRAPARFETGRGSLLLVWKVGADLFWECAFGNGQNRGKGEEPSSLFSRWRPFRRIQRSFLVYWAKIQNFRKKGPSVPTTSRWSEPMRIFQKRAFRMRVSERAVRTHRARASRNGARGGTVY